MQSGRPLLLAALALLSTGWGTVAEGAAALAIVNTERGYQYYWDGNQSSVREAEDRALTACARNAYVEKHIERCRVVLSGDGPAYYAVVRSADGAIGYAKDEVEWGAVSQARDNCNRYANCPSNADGLWYDRIPFTRMMTEQERRLWEMEQERLRRERELARKKEHGATQ